jgi:hypothetical protein
VRKHPGAVIAAAGSGGAVRQGAQDGAEVVKESVEKLEAKVEDVQAALTRKREPDRISEAETNKPPLTIEGEIVVHEDESEKATAVVHEASQRVHLSDEERKELVDALCAKDRAALKELARKR